jgi:hypothetical protein
MVGVGHTRILNDAVRAWRDDQDVEAPDLLMAGTIDIGDVLFRITPLPPIADEPPAVLVEMLDHSGSVVACERLNLSSL